MTGAAFVVRKTTGGIPNDGEWHTVWQYELPTPYGETRHYAVTWTGVLPETSASSAPVQCRMYLPDDDVNSAAWKHTYGRASGGQVTLTSASSFIRKPEDLNYKWKGTVEVSCRTIPMSGSYPLQQQITAVQVGGVTRLTSP